jgi:1,2-diacylglycerol 3-alpha-glucosyltransferase
MILPTKIKRIGILTNTYPPIKNGVSMAVYGLEQELTKRGIEVYIATPEVEGVKYADNVFCFPAIELPKDISADLKIAPVYTNKVKKYFKSKDIQLIHTHDTLFGGIEGASIAQDLDIPSVHTFHTLIEQYKMVSFPAYKRVIRRAIKEVCNSYSAVIAPSTKAYLYLLEKVVAPISQIYNVTYLNSIEYEETYRFDLSGIKHDDFVFITFCRCAKEKGLDTAIDILAPIMIHNPRVKYIIAGDGPSQDELREQALKLGVASQVIFVGGYNPTELKSLVQNSEAKVFLFTSTTDNLPTNPVEAMNLGLPVLSIDDKSIDYIVRDDYNGIICPLGELTSKAIDLICDEKLVQRLKIGAIASAKEFLQKDIVGEHIKLYERVMDMYEPTTDLLDIIIPPQVIQKIRNTLYNLGDL